MKILFYRYNSICEPDIIQAFKELGHSVCEIREEMTNKAVTPSECVHLVSNAPEKTLEYHTYEKRVELMLESL